jgi:glycosyltransferase involved in cell wall biosynthesis
VSYEALAAGLPVIATASAGTPVRDGVDGFVVEAGDVDRCAALLRQLRREPTRLAAMSQAAREAAGALTLAAYRDRLLPHLMGTAPSV